MVCSRALLAFPRCSPPPDADGLLANTFSGADSDKHRRARQPRRRSPISSGLRWTAQLRLWPCFYPPMLDYFFVWGAWAMLERFPGAPHCHRGGAHQQLCSVLTWGPRRRLAETQSLSGFKRTVVGERCTVLQGGQRWWLCAMLAQQTLHGPPSSAKPFRHSGCLRSLNPASKCIVRKTLYGRQTGKQCMPELPVCMPHAPQVWLCPCSVSWGLHYGCTCSSWW